MAETNAERDAFSRKPRKVMMGLRFTAETRDRLNAHARKVHGIACEIVEDAVHEYLDRLEAKERKRKPRRRAA